MSTEIVNDSTALQDICLPTGTCYGCGSANAEGLQIKSYWSADGQFVVCRFEPEAKFSSGFKNAMYGGLIASLIDCHSNWTAMAFGYRAEGREPGSKPLIASVTGSLGVKFLKPTPMDQPIHLKAWVEGEVGRKTRVLCELGTAQEVTAMGDSVFVRIDPALFI
ncbi:MAG: PaaI family thioesterase [Anaerolineae bacterium]|nr:PaaI family thioesterase [Anaerolineae bacterium]